MLSSDDSVLKDFARTISPELGQCIGFQLGKTANVTSVSVSRVPFPKTGAVSAAYRAMLEVRTPHGDGKLLSDYVFFGEGRVGVRVHRDRTRRRAIRARTVRGRARADPAAACGRLVIMRALLLALAAGLVVAAVAAADPSGPEGSTRSRDGAPPWLGGRPLRYPGCAGAFGRRFLWHDDVS